MSYPFKTWIYEDELPEGYPYDEMFPFSWVDIVRLFPPIEFAQGYMRCKSELEKHIAEHPGQVEQAYKEALAVGYTTGHKENQDIPFEWIEPFWLNSDAYARLKGEKE